MEFARILASSEYKPPHLYVLLFLGINTTSIAACTSLIGCFISLTGILAISLLSLLALVSIE